VLEVFGYISGIISVFCFLPYIRDILLKKTKPERASWLIWSVLGGIAFFSQLAKGASYSLWMPGVQTFWVMLIFLLSLKFGVGGLSKRDLIALTIAVFGLVLWHFTKEPAFALFITIIVDAIGCFLTIMKVREDPKSETISTWLLSGLSGVFAALAVGSFNFILLIYPIYIWLVNWSVVAVILISSRRLLATRKDQ